MAVLMVDALLLRPMRMKDSTRVVEVWEDASWMGFPQNTPSASQPARLEGAQPRLQ
jgi:hypothetical protein